MKKTNCIVIGGGVIGMTTALELARRGLSVKLLDKSKFGQEASWAAGGILSSMRPWSENANSAELSNQGKSGYEHFAIKLKEETGIDPEYYQCGLLMINAADIARTKQWTERQIKITRYDCQNSPLNIPEHALLLPEIAQIRVPRLLKALKASLLKHHVGLHENTQVTALDMVADKCNRLQVGAEYYYADAVIITAGAWSQRLLARHSRGITIKPVHGQMLCVKFPKQRLYNMVLDGGHYLIPRLDGHVLIGSTVEDLGFQKKTTPAARDKLMNWASRLWPEIDTASLVQHWSGLRPATERGEPYVDRLKGYDNIFINTGHFRKGILQAPVCAKKIMEMVCQYLT